MTASRSRRLSDLKAVTNTSAVAWLVLITRLVSLISSAMQENHARNKVAAGTEQHKNGPLCGLSRR
jgi:hypothetical protein